MFKRATPRFIAVAALALASCVTGWALGLRESDARLQASTDGTPSLHVDRVVPDWRSPGLDRRFVIPDMVGSDVDDEAPAAYESTRETADETAAVVDEKLLERTLMEGTDSERLAALVRALEAGMELPPQLLWQTYASDPFERVRLLALTTYVDSVADDRSSVRSALESAVQDPSTAVQTEARRRLAELDQFERMLAESLPQGM